MLPSEICKNSIIWLKNIQNTGNNYKLDMMFYLTHIDIDKNPTCLHCIGGAYLLNLDNTKPDFASYAKKDQKIAYFLDSVRKGLLRDALKSLSEELYAKCNYADLPDHNTCINNKFIEDNGIEAVYDFLEECEKIYKKIGM